MGFAVILPRQITPALRREVMKVCGEVAENGLNAKKVWDWKLEAVDATPLAQTLRAVTWTSPARRWSSVTPILLDRFPKKKGPTVEEILAAACRRIGLPEPVAIEHGPYSKVQGVAPVPAFRLQRKADEKPRWGVHATLEFPGEVVGPVLLGAGRYFGLGLMRPDREER
jgi:CRISPR-associated protein Csb2